MAKGKGGGKGGERNTDRPGGKAFKKRSGEPAGRNNGKTKGGYSPAKLEARRIVRKLSA